MDDLTIAKLQYARNYICRQEIYYREKEICQYKELKQFRSGSVNAFLVFHRTLHPYFSLFSHFDYRMKRLTRLSFVLGQISMITLLLWVCYSRLFDEWGITEAMGEHRPYYLSIILSIFTLPMPRRLFCFCETQMYLLKVKYDNEADDEENQALNKSQHVDTGEEQNDQVSQNQAMNILGNDLENQDLEPKKKVIDVLEEPPKSRPVLFDRWLQLKLISILFIFIFWALTIAINIYFSEASGRFYIDKADDAP